jgi:hypothetical protein
MEQPSRPHAGEDHAFMIGIAWLGHDTGLRMNLANITPDRTKKV